MNKYISIYKIPSKLNKIKPYQSWNNFFLLLVHQRNHTILQTTVQISSPVISIQQAQKIMICKSKNWRTARNSKYGLNTQSSPTANLFNNLVASMWIIWWRNSDKCKCFYIQVTWIKSEVPCRIYKDYWISK